MRRMPSKMMEKVLEEEGKKEGDKGEDVFFYGKCRVCGLTCPVESA